MNTRVVNGLVSIVVAACVAFAAPSLPAGGEEPFEDVWKGSTPDLGLASNWENGVVPGRVNVTDESGTTTVVGPWGCTMIFLCSQGDHQGRLFTDSLVSTSKMIFRGAGTRRHYIYPYRYLNLEAGGGIYIDEDVGMVPYFDAQAHFNIANATAVNNAVTIRNDSSQESFVLTKVSTQADVYGTGYSGVRRLIIDGKGDVKFAGPIYELNGNYALEILPNGGKVIFDNNGAELNVSYVKVGESENKQIIQVADGVLLKTRVNGDDSRPFVILADTDIVGGGTVYVGRPWAQSSNFQIAPGKTLTVGVTLQNYGNDGGAAQDFKVLGGGTMVMAETANNIIRGSAVIAEQSTLSATEIGMGGVVSPIGQGTAIKIGTGGRFLYTGSGETSDRTVDFGTGGGVFEHGGTGCLTIGSLSLSADSELKIAANASLTLRAITRTAGILNIVAAQGSVVTVAGATAGKAPDWMRYNGVAARYGENGAVQGIDGPADITIDARGGVIPNVPDLKVAITTATGSGAGVSLAESPVEVYVLAQEQSVEPAIVTVADGQKLVARNVIIPSGAKSLVVSGDGEFSGEMSLIGGDLVRSNATTGGSVSLASVGGTASLSLDGNLTRSDPLTLEVRSGEVKAEEAGEVPVVELAANGGDLDLKVVSASDPDAVANYKIIAYSPKETLVAGNEATGSIRFDGGSFTGRVSIGSSATQGGGSIGALYMSGGELVNVMSGESSQSPIGYNGFGYLEVLGGVFKQAGCWYIGGNRGETILAVHGGTIVHTANSERRSRCDFGHWYGRGVLHVADGGKFDASSAYYWSVGIPGSNVKDANCELTVDDGGEIDFGSLPIYLGGHAQNNSAYHHYLINLNGGVFRGYSVSRFVTETPWSDEFPEGTGGADRLNSYGFVNANGGTFRAHSGDIPLFGDRVLSGNNYPITRVTLFKGGLTIDTAGKNPYIGVGGALQAPSGKGVVGIPWDAAADGSGFIGSPVVLIVGDGKGASAYAEFDSTTKLVTSISVTSPGNDYTYANAEVYYCGTKVKTIACELEDNVSGGFTKDGLGTLTMNGTNTYTGATVVKAGTLKVGADDVFCATSRLVLEGGTLDMNEKAQTFADVTCTGGAIINGKPCVSNLVIDFDAAAAGNPKTVGGVSGFDYADGAEVILLGFSADKLEDGNRYVLAEFPAGLPTNLPDLTAVEAMLPSGWKISYVGTKLKLRQEKGLAIIVR